MARGLIQHLRGLHHITSFARFLSSLLAQGLVTQRAIERRVLTSHQLTQVHPKLIRLAPISKYALAFDQSDRSPLALVAEGPVRCRRAMYTVSHPLADSV